jgi:glycerol uptake facilitator protein
MVITTGWAFAVLCGIFTANLFGSADAHLNPAITMAFAMKTGEFSKMFPYLAAQVAGSFSAAAVVWLPAIRSYGFNLFSEIVGAFVLVIVVGAMTSKLVLTTGAVAGLTS